MLIRWLLLGVAASAVASIWGMVHEYAVIAAFCVFFANFATFCILYDRPKDRARMRVEGQLRGMHPNSDLAQRLSTAAIVPNEGDRSLGFGPMPLLNFATGLAGAVIAGWGLVLRLF